MSDNISTFYAIRLPDGQLAHDLPAAIMQGHPEYKTLPGGQKAWLWGEDRRHEAYQTLHAIAEHVKPWGAETLMKAHAAVVMVRTTVEILDGDHDPEPPDDEQPTAPRTWRSVQEIPMGVQFRLAGGNEVYLRVLEGGIHLPGNTILPLTYFTGYPNGYVEVTR